MRAHAYSEDFKKLRFLNPRSDLLLRLWFWRKFYSTKLNKKLFSPKVLIHTQDSTHLSEKNKPHVKFAPFMLTVWHCFKPSINVTVDFNFLTFLLPARSFSDPSQLHFMAHPHCSSILDASVAWDLMRTEGGL